MGNLKVEGLYALKMYTRKLAEILGVDSVILDCEKAIVKAIDIAVKTASMYEARTYKILASPPEGEILAYRCSLDSPLSFIDICKGDKHIYIRYDYDRAFLRAIVRDASESIFCTKRESKRWKENQAL